MENIEIEVSGQTYRIGSIDAFEQLKVMRKLAPLLAGAIGGNLEGVVMSVSSLDDASSNIVFNVLLKCVQRKCERGVYASVLASQNEESNKPALMFSDMDGGDVILLAVESAKLNLKKPLATLQSKLSAEQTQALSG